MSVPLVILGFLQEKDYHGYELKKQIQRNMGNWTDIKFGSIYHALKKLVDRGSVEVVGEEHQVGRPDRTIYRITPRGREEMRSLLNQLLSRFQRTYFEFDIGLFFAARMPQEDLSGHLEKRLAAINAFMQKLGQVKNLPIHKTLPKISEVIVDHTICHMNAELEWAQMCARRLSEEDLYKPPKKGSRSPVREG
jgi:DNA-binding PadR family transcriptional regulator